MVIARLRMESQTTIHAVDGAPPLPRMMLFATGRHGKTWVEHVTAVRTVADRDPRAPMIQIGTRLLRHAAAVLRVHVCPSGDGSLLTAEPTG